MRTGARFDSSVRFCPPHTVLVVRHLIGGRGHRQVPMTLHLQFSPAAQYLPHHFRVYPEIQSQIVKFWVGSKLKIHEFSLNFKLTSVSFDVASVCCLYLGIRCGLGACVAVIHHMRMWNSIEHNNLFNAFRGSDTSNQASDQKRWGVPSVRESYQMKCQIIAFHVKMIRLH